MKKVHHYNKRYREWLRKKIASMPGQVFNRQDLSHNLSNRIQLRLNRALKAFINEGIIIKVSHGLYAKAEAMIFPDGEKKSVLKEPFEKIAIEALNKLDLAWAFGTAIQEYNDGKTTQVPVVFTIQLKSRFRGTIGAEGRSVLFEGGINAR